MNHFTGCPLPPVLRDMPGPLGKAIREGVTDAMQVPAEFGLCGGMSLAAADFYHASLRTPANQSPPAPGTPLYEYLFRRQNDSLGSLGIMATKFAQWMTLPDRSDTPETPSTARLTFDELRPIAAKLARGELVPLGLVYVRATGNTQSNARAGMMWENHQVLAYRIREQNQTLELAIYDPNYPHLDSITLRVELKMPDAPKDAEPTERPRAGLVERLQEIDGGEALCSMWRLKNGEWVKVRDLRGAFGMPYSRVVPPGNLGGTQEEPDGLVAKPKP